MPAGWSSLIYSALRILLDALATSRAGQAELQAEVLAPRRQVQVLEGQIKRVRWSPGDRMILAALRERIPRSGWAGLLVKPETVLGWHSTSDLAGSLDGPLTSSFAWRMVRSAQQMLRFRNGYKHAHRKLTTKSGHAAIR